MAFYRILASLFPDLKDKLKSAGLVDTPDHYVKQSFQSSMTFAIGISVTSLFFFLKFGQNILLSFLVFLIIFMMFFFVMMKRVDAKIIKREKEIDKDVLFAGRFLLVKLNSGTPLINSLVDASKSYGVASKFFMEIVRDIDLGTPLEQALHNAYKSTPSKRFKKILFQINNALKIGVDISAPLEATLDEIAQEQLVEIQRYGRKLSSLIMFYMMVAIVVPSLGITLFSLIASLLSLAIDMQLFLTVLFLVIVMQFMFIAIFRSIRPNLNI